MFKNEQRFPGCNRIQTPSFVVDVKSPLHSSTRNLANKRRKLVKSPGFINYDLAHDVYDYALEGSVLNLHDDYLYRSA